MCGVGGDHSKAGPLLDAPMIGLARCRSPRRDPTDGACIAVSSCLFDLVLDCR